MPIIKLKSSLFNSRINSKKLINFEFKMPKLRLSLNSRPLFCISSLAKFNNFELLLETVENMCDSTCLNGKTCTDPKADDPWSMFRLELAALSYLSFGQRGEFQGNKVSCEVCNLKFHD